MKKKIEFIKKHFPHYKQIILILVLLILLPVSLTFSRFIFQKAYNFYLNSKNFYFTSNRLSEAKEEYLINTWSGVETFAIEFNLNSEKNSLLKTDYDIPFEIGVSCDDDVRCEVSENPGVIFASSNSARVVITATPLRIFDKKERTTIHVFAKSTAPYTKKISADFTLLVEEQGISYSITDEIAKTYLTFEVTNAKSYCNVTQAFSNYSVGDAISSVDFERLSTEDKNKCVSKMIYLTFNPNDVRLDTASDILSYATIDSYQTINNVSYISAIHFPMNALSSKNIKFYKSNTRMDYTYPFENPTSIITMTTN